MSWNYRIIEHDTWFGLHEVYYDKQGNLRSWAVEPEVATDKENGVSDLVSSIEMMLKDAKSDRKILTEADFKPHTVEPEVFFANLSSKVSEIAADKVLAPYRDISERVASKMKLEMPDDVIGHLGKSHIVFGTACAYEAAKELPALLSIAERAADVEGIYGEMNMTPGVAWLKTDEQKAVAAAVSRYVLGSE